MDKNEPTIPTRPSTQADRETEIKFSADPADLKRVLESPLFASASEVRNQLLRTIYFDTSESDLRKEGIALRIRKPGRNAAVLGVKAKLATGEGPFSRTEIEVRSRSLQPDLTLFDPATATALGLIVGQRPLEAQFETVIRRRSILVEFGRAQIEVACDDGHAVAGERRLPLTEVELELKSGGEGDLYGLALKLADEFPLRLELVSKAEKGFRLATSETPTAIKARGIEYDAEVTLDDAVIVVISNTLAQFVGNWPALRVTDQPEAVHQARVALRRLRAALALFGRALPCPAFEELRGEARRIASALGPARECDVFRKSALKGPLAHPDRPDQADGLLAAVEDRRAAAYRDVRALIEDLGTTRFVLKVFSLLARRAWRNALSGSELTLLAGPASKFAESALDRLRRRVKKRGEQLTELNDEERHELRIALKNLRYGVEFFGSLFGRRRIVRRYAGAVSLLQDLLGAHNDVATSRQFLDDLPEGMERMSGFILGWYARGTALADADLFDASTKFKKIEPFWR